MSEKTLGNTDSKGAKENVRDIEFWGNPDAFALLSKASSEKEGWMKSTKAMETGSGCVVQVTTQQRNPDGSWSVAEAVTFVPGVIVVSHSDENKKIMSRSIMTPEQYNKLTTTSK